ncbi:hypothetical protein [Hippea maritima]|uniref:Thiamine biosynthesis protein ThiS n=1 Tax=Hippea maritima (strain ATCC 700847 / DSM 10411 / MH2) TaxID=760142 RepID=F2LTH1_HIPMA|nr:hypothetical protein [Hippea maritima]AEA33296.1 hypothetical protein Hipma_0319 [Hippea maritima DSM 10411]
MVKVRVEGTDRFELFETPISVGKILKKLDFLPFEVLVINKNRLLTRDIVLRDDEEIILRVVYSKG